MVSPKINDMEITKLTESDIENLAELYKQFWNENSNIDKMKDSFRKIKQDPNYIYLVAKDNGILVGTVMGVVCENLYGECKPFMVVEDVIVSNYFRRKGVGRMLMLKLEKSAIEHKCCQSIFVIERNRDDAVAFYQSLGYETGKYTGFKKKLMKG